MSVRERVGAHIVERDRVGAHTTGVKVAVLSSSLGASSPCNSSFVSSGFFSSSLMVNYTYAGVVIDSNEAVLGLWRGARRWDGQTTMDATGSGDRESAIEGLAEIHFDMITSNQVVIVC